MEILRILRAGVWGYWKFVTASLKLMRVGIEINTIIGIQMKFAWKFIKFDDVGMNFGNLI